jgi:hypothetical protein
MAPFVAANDIEPTLWLAVSPGPGPDRYEVHVNGAPYARAQSAHEVLPLLFMLLFAFTCHALPERLLFHSAVLVHGGRAVLFPAETGAGKTTLTAALAAHGYGYFSDEIAIIDPETVRVSPLPLPMSVKPGSVPLLAPYYPRLEASPRHHRRDGKRVRYLLPPADTLPRPGRSAEIHGVVFIRHQRDSAPALRRLDRVDALQRLAATGSSDRELRENDVCAMIDIVEKGHCYELVYSRLEPAIRLLERHVL